MIRLLRGACAGIVVLVLTLILLNGLARADPPSEDIAAQSAHVEQLWRARKYADALATQEKVLAATEKAEKAGSGKPGVATGVALGNTAYYALFARRYSQALAASERGRKLAPDEISIETNRAHALMFLGRSKEARNLYQAHRDKRLPTGSLWQDEIEDDFIKLTDAGLGHSLMPAVLKELSIREPRGGYKRGAVLKQVLALNQAKNYAEALPAAQRYAALVQERYGDNHIRYAEAISLVGRFLPADESVPFYRRGLEIAEDVFGRDNVSVVPYLERLAAVDKTQTTALVKRVIDLQAIAMAERAIYIAKKTAGADIPQLLRELKARAQEAEAQSNPWAATLIYERAFALTEKILPLGHPDRIEIMHELIERYFAERRGGREESIGMLERLVGEIEQSKGVTSPEFRSEFSYLANLYGFLDEDPDSDIRRKRILETYESKLGSDDLGIAHHAAGLTRFYTRLGRLEEAEPLYERALSVALKYVDRVGAQGLDEFRDRWILELLGDRADVLSSRGSHAEAIALRERIVTLSEKKFNEGSIEATLALSYLASEYYATGDWVQAVAAWRRTTSRFISAYRGNSEDLYRRHVDREEHGRWSSHFVGLISGLHRTSGVQPESEPILMQETFQLAQWALNLNSGEPIAQMAARSGNPQLAALVREGDALALRVVNEYQLTDVAKKEIRERIATLGKHLEAEFPGYGALAKPEALTIADAQSALRDNEALVLIVDGDDAFSRAPIDDVFVWVVTKTDARWMKSTLGFTELKGHVSALRCGLDASIWDHPISASTCSSLVSVRPERDENDAIRWETLPYDLIRAHAIYTALLEPFEDMTKGKHLLVVPSDGLNQLPLHLLVTSLPADTNLTVQDRRVGALGTMLSGATTGPLHKYQIPRGVEVLRPVPGGPGDLAGLRAGDRLLSVQGQDIYSLPHAIAAVRSHAPGSQVSLEVQRGRRTKPLTLTAKLGELVVQDRPERFLKADKDRATQWLARRHAITVLPSVFALKSLRRVGKPSAASRPLLAVGNPLLDGLPEESARAEAARSKQSCPELVKLRRVASSTRRLQMRGNSPGSAKIASAQEIRLQPPLPETAEELCAVASHMKVEPEDVLLGQRATEAAIKRLNGEGRLSDYRVLHFATHGTLGGEIGGVEEAGLLLTPPESGAGSENDDAYLSASEVANLKLDAEWVVLSACNTAGNSRAYAQLPRAFFYAGARALLASHWAVASHATVKLVTRTIESASAMGRAEALRDAMLAMIDQGEPYETHPAYWGPFVVMGEGG